jgi:hypothetical protein
VQKVEGVEQQAVLTPGGQVGLKGAEIGALADDDHDLAVDDGLVGAGAAKLGRDRGEPPSNLISWIRPAPAGSFGFRVASWAPAALTTWAAG